MFAGLPHYFHVYENYLKSGSYILQVQLELSSFESANQYLCETMQIDCFLLNYLFLTAKKGWFYGYV